MARLIDSFTIVDGQKVPSRISTKMRRSLFAQASRFSLRSTVAAATVAGIGLFGSSTAWGQCTLSVGFVSCGETVTTDTTSPGHSGNQADPSILATDRHYNLNDAGQVILAIDGGASITGNGLAITNNGTGGVQVINRGAVTVDAGNAPTSGGNAALAITSASGPITYFNDGRVTNAGTGDGLSSTQNGAGSTTLSIYGDVRAAMGSGIVVSDAASSTGIDVSTGGPNKTTTLAAGNNGIEIFSQSLTGDVTVTAYSNITAGTDGILAILVPTAATGNVVVTSNGTIVGDGGIDARNFGSGNVTVTTTDTVTAGSRGGIYAQTASGDIVISAGDVTSVTGDGVTARQLGNVTAQSIDMTVGSVSGYHGIAAGNDSAGVTVVHATGTVTGTVLQGILAFGGGTKTLTIDDTVTGRTEGVNISTSAGDITLTGAGGVVGGLGNAATIQNTGTGKVRLDIAGDSSSTAGNGIFVRDVAGSTGIDVTIGAVSALAAGKRAIDAQSLSQTGDLKITANGDLQAGDTGVMAVMLSNTATGAVDVTTKADVTGDTGMWVRNNGNGATTVAAAGPITGTGSQGVNISGNGAVTVTLDDIVKGATDALVVSAGGTGDISVTAAGLSATDGYAAMITNSGTGKVLLDISGDTSSTNRGGIIVNDDFRSTGIAVTTGAVTAAGHAINVQSVGRAADVTIVANGDIAATGGVGIRATRTNAGGTGDIGVTAQGTVTGTTGIQASNTGAGTIDIATAGAVTGTAGAGITVSGRNAVTLAVDDVVTGTTAGLVLSGGTGGAGNITVSGAGGFVGGTGDAATIQNSGSGKVLVNMVGGSASTGGNGIYIRDVAGSTGIDVTTGAISALAVGKNAIDVASQSLTGDVTVVANGDIAAGGTGIFAQNTASTGTGNVAVTANDTVDGAKGIDARNAGSGSTTVTAVGQVTATNDHGIYAQASNGDVSVTAGDITATGGRAVVVLQDGTAVAKAVDVTVGTVSGDGGILASNESVGTTTLHATGTVTGTAGTGILVFGGGAVAVTIDDVVTGSDQGMQLSTSSGDIKLTGAGGVVGDQGAGAAILNYGTGKVLVDIAGDASSTDDHGIWVRDVEESTGIDITTGKVTSATQNAIDVQSVATAGDVKIVANGDIAAAQTGILAYNNTSTSTGNIAVTTNGAVDASNGIDARNSGNGTITVIATGAVTATNGFGIYADAAGDVSVTAGDVTATGDTAVDVRARAGAGAGAVDIAVGTVSGDQGIFAASDSTGAINIHATGTVTGTVGTGIAAFGNGAVTLTMDDTVTGNDEGVHLATTAGDITLTGARGVVGGTGVAASIENSGTGKILVNIAGDSSSTDSIGFYVRDVAGSSGIDVTTGAVTALTDGANAIDVASDSLAGAVTITANGDIAAGGAGILASINPSTATGNLTVTANGAVESNYGINVRNLGTGTTTVTTVGPVTASNGSAIYAEASAGNVTVKAGDVTATGDTAIIVRQDGTAVAKTVDVTVGTVSGDQGIDVTNNSAGATTIHATGTVTGTVNSGIAVQAYGSVAIKVDDIVTGAANGLYANAGGAGDITVTGTGGFVAGTGNAATIVNDGSGKVLVNVSGDFSSTDGGGLYVADFTNATGMNITTGAVTALNGDGIFTVSQSNAGDITIVAKGDVQAKYAGISGTIFNADGTGNVAITAQGLVESSYGIDAENYGSGNVTIKAGTVTSTNGSGISALSNGGNIAVLAGTVTGTNDIGIVAQNIADTTGTIDIVAGSASGSSGIAAFTTGTGAVSVTSSGTVTGTQGWGISAESTRNGSVTITSNGAVSGVASGILANSLGDATTSGNVIVNANANVSASDAFGGAGILAVVQGGGAGTIAVNQAAGSVISATGGAGIRTDSGNSTGATTIVVAGEVIATGAGNAGIRGNSTSGDITVQVKASGKVDPDYGIDLSTIDGVLKIDNAGLVVGDVTGARLLATGAGTAIVNNAGTITGATSAIEGKTNNTVFTLFNTGTLNGTVNVTGSNIAQSIWTNAAGATANLGSGSSSFAGNLSNAGATTLGTNGALAILGTMTNTGRLTMGGGAMVTINGALANSGVIDLQNNLTNNIVRVAGNYSGGGQLFVDYSTQTNSADQLIIGGTASGTTIVTLNRVGPSTVVPGGFLTVVTVTGGAAESAFTSNSVFTSPGFIRESFGRNPNNATQFGVIQSVNPIGESLGNLTYMAEAASNQIDEPLAPYVTNRTSLETNDVRFSLWMRGGGGYTKQRVNATLSGGGFNSVTSNLVRVDHHAAQIGADLAIRNIGGSAWDINVGAMGGWYDGQSSLAAGDSMKVETPFAGAYVVAGDDALSVEATVRREWRHYRVVMPTLLGGAAGLRDLNGRATAYSLRAAYRVGGDSGFAATPFVNFNYADSAIDPLRIDAFSVWTPGSDKTKVGQAGLRLSYRAGSPSGVRIEPFASVARLENWSRGDSSTFSVGTPVASYALDTLTWKDAMRYSVGLMGNAAESRVSGFLVGNVNDGSKMRSFTINAGLRFNF